MAVELLERGSAPEARCGAHEERTRRALHVTLGTWAACSCVYGRQWAGQAAQGRCSHQIPIAWEELVETLEAAGDALERRKGVALLLLGGLPLLSPVLEPDLDAARRDLQLLSQLVPYDLSTQRSTRRREYV